MTQRKIESELCITNNVDGTAIIATINKGKGLRSEVKIDKEEEDEVNASITFLHGDEERTPPFESFKMLMGPRQGNKFKQNGFGIEELVFISYWRLKELSKKFSCKENEDALDNLSNAFCVLAQRMRDREQRGVLGERKE